MDFPSESVIAILTYLLPGFITAAVVYALTPEPRPIPFERVVQALIFTMLVQAFVIVIGSVLGRIGADWFALGVWTEQVRFVWSVLVAGVLGLFLAWAMNTDRILGLLRAARITTETSFSSEWHGAFSRNKGFVVLHLAGGRRLYGWTHERPSTPDRGHFVMEKAEWLDDEQCTELRGVERILIRAQDVEMVEMMKADESQEDLHASSESAGTSAAPRLQTNGRGQTAGATTAVQTTGPAPAPGQEVTD